MRTIKKFRTQYINKLPDGKKSQGEIRNRVLFFDDQLLIADIWLNDEEVGNEQLAKSALATKIIEAGAGYFTIDEWDQYLAQDWVENTEERSIGIGGYTE